ncbi:alpha/beta fold hydrolase [Nocardioides donggukensis]|uniref:Alpha/beta fold hydrolase n=1 Tax=Nocardioides donggukensis TaxID=2774019 RepID=A0A927Q2T0_9ACTN|nr:alpha/beta fold hydrolase [Nocardioides donggukensis]MBD8869941.1 alpha/beta fold hydrolase [Nocardioides donggukensis]
MGAPEFDLQHVTVHGHRRAFVSVGSGPTLLLLHGLGCDHTTWYPVIRELSRRYRVIAPDLLGHGRSDKPRADYSLGGYANGMRDLLTVLGIDRATVVGHSFGGGVAMQFGYQFPERTERLVLVAPGGVGPEVTPAIRAITTPGFDQLMRLLTLPGARHLGVAGMRALHRTGLPATRDLAEAAAIFDSWQDHRVRAAVRHLTRAVVDWRGQVVTMSDRAYLTEAMPLCVVWGEQDHVLPAHQARNVAALAPQARVEVFPNAGHFPHKDHPQRFVKVLKDFLRSTEPSVYDRDRMRRLLAEGAPAVVRQAEAGDAPVAPVQQLSGA